MAVEELREKSKSTAILIARNGMGECEKELQQILINLYFMLLQENELYPGAICFYGDGVKLVIEGSPVLNTLQELEQKGVRLIICKTCLKHYGLENKVKVGTVGGMNDIVMAQWMADKVIAL
jgi:intracellular sulfur oxidation DsrE/DsrF family protein